MTKHGRIPYRLVQLQANKPAKQQVKVDVINKLSFRLPILVEFFSCLLEMTLRSRLTPRFDTYMDYLVILLSFPTRFFPTHQLHALSNGDCTVIVQGKLNSYY